MLPSSNKVLNITHCQDTLCNSWIKASNMGQQTPTNPVATAAVVLCMLAGGAWDHSARHLYGTVKSHYKLYIYSSHCDRTSALIFNFQFNSFNREATCSASKLQLVKLKLKIILHALTTGKF